METPGKLSLWAIEIFVATVEEGSVSAAAKRLHASVSAISQQLTNLETALGATLLDRSKRPQQVTSAGAMFLRRAQLILAQAAQAKTELASFNDSQTTRLRIGIIDDFDADVTPALMLGLARQMTGCQFLLESGGSYAMAERLESRSLDVIVAADQDASAPWMEVHPLMTDPFIVVAPKGLITPHNPVLKQLLQHPLIRYSSRQMMGRQIENHLLRQGISLPNRFEFDSYHAIMAMVAGGAGWAITTPLGYMRAQRFHDELDVLALPFNPLSRNISLIARGNTLADIPVQIAHDLRPMIREILVAPMVARCPWLMDDLTVS